VRAYIVTSDAEGPVVANVKRKEREATATMAQIVQYTHDAVAGRNTRQEGGIPRRHGRRRPVDVASRRLRRGDKAAAG